MQPLLSVPVTWLSIDLGLPTNDHPQVETVTSAPDGGGALSRPGLDRPPNVAIEAGALRQLKSARTSMRSMTTSAE